VSNQPKSAPDLTRREYAALRLARKVFDRYRTPDTFGPRLRELRKARGLTQKQLADAAGVDSTYLSKVEAGRMTAPKEATLRWIAEALNYSGDRLVLESGRVPARYLPDVTAKMLRELEAKT
jgi:transcriptional regulator with XRE-family HTH domain